jgi:hypothetical protein
MKSYLIKPELSQLSIFIIKSKILKPDTPEEAAASSSRSYIIFLPLVKKQNCNGNYSV